MTPRKKRQRYIYDVQKIAARLKCSPPTEWEEIWAFLDQHGTPERPMHVYAIVDYAAGLVKIGKSTYPGRRLQALQTSNGRPLKIWGFCRERSPVTEKEIHARLAQYRVRGEWFKLNEQVQGVINEIRAEGGR